MPKKEARRIKIAATSDIHGFLDGLEDDIAAIRPDVLVIAGDIHPCRLDMDADYWFRKEFFPLVERLLPTQVVAVPGNHDFWLNELLQKHGGLGRLQCMGEVPPNFHLLCDSWVIVKGLDFYGTPWVPWINGKWCWEASDRTLEYEFAKIPEDADVLIAHSPPLINHDFVDISLDHDKRYWRHFGSKALTCEIIRKKPRVVFCGHIHSGKHGGIDIKDREGKPICKCYNVSRVNEQYNVAYNLQVVELPAKD